MLRCSESASDPQLHADFHAKRIYRLYKELGLQLRNKTPKRRVKAKLREDRRPAVHANETWAILARQALQGNAVRGLCP